ncbi:MAG: hypothetical protein JO107_15070, partial [Hyphomicrobiales bacterium]|nr:hypothetical protein [Hyphomicrobiales bacterium]
MLRHLPRLALTLLLGLAGSAAARAAEDAAAAACLYAPAPPPSLAGLETVADYQSVLRGCHAADGRATVAVRTMSIGGTPLLLLADPQKLTTRLERAAC